MKPAFEPPQSRKAPCPCGSGRRYKHCHGARPKTVARPKRRWPGWAVGVVIAAVIGGIVTWQRSSSAPPFSSGGGAPLFREGSGGFGGAGYAFIDGVDMSGLNETQRAAVMQQANAERCFCGCRMTLAQCINVDTACPLRGAHFQRARQLVARAARGS